MAHYRDNFILLYFAKIWSADVSFPFYRYCSWVACAIAQVGSALQLTMEAWLQLQGSLICGGQ
jgi:hypothetical protein